MPDDRGPLARALACLALVQGRPGIGAHQLAERLGVSDRAVRRYVATLREAEIPVVSTSGPHGGYRLGRGVRMPPLLFTEAEALALTMAAMVGVHHQDDVVARSLDKLVRALPGEVGEQAAAMWRRAVATPARADALPDPSTSSTLVSLAAERRRARLTYRSARGSLLERTVDPWALVVRRSSWYLLCLDQDAGAIRTYRVDRVTSVVGLAERFEAPADLDPAAAVEQHLGAGRRHPTLVRFEAPVEQVRPLVGAVMGRLEPVDGGAACLLTGTTDNPAMYAGEWLAAIPLPFRVIGGEELRAAVRDVAVRMAGAVGGTPAG